MYCSVILGKMESVPEGSNQNYPSSDQFASRVDDLVVPRTYIVWSAFMNSHIFPKYIISFRSPSLNMDMTEAEEGVECSICNVLSGNLEICSICVAVTLGPDLG